MHVCIKFVAKDMNYQQREDIKEKLQEHEETFSQKGYTLCVTNTQKGAYCH